MAVTIGTTPDAGFDEPLRLLADCHRRIELFLGVLSRLAADSERPLPPDHRNALRRSLTYFDEAAPRHTEDEEHSLFPRIRASPDPALRDALARLATLESDHDRADILHAQVGAIGRDWLRLGSLDAATSARLCAILAELDALYARHIRLEEEVIFAAAGRALDACALVEIGREMAARRGLTPSGERPPGPASAP